MTYSHRPESILESDPRHSLSAPRPHPDSRVLSAEAQAEARWRAAVFHNLRFVSLWLQRPASLGAVMPSSKSLAMAMARQVDAREPGTVVELGGGTGNITAALLDSAVEPRDIVVIEREPALHAVISSRFPGIEVICGDARQLGKLLGRAGVSRVKAVISGLPLLSMSERSRQRIVAQAVAAIGSDGTFVQFTYGPAAPVSRVVAVDLGIVGKRTSWILSNIPPASVWCYRRRATPPPVGGAI